MREMTFEEYNSPGTYPFLRIGVREQYTLRKLFVSNSGTGPAAYAVKIQSVAQGDFQIWRNKPPLGILDTLDLDEVQLQAGDGVDFVVGSGSGQIFEVLATFDDVQVP